MAQIGDVDARLARQGRVQRFGPQGAASSSLFPRVRISGRSFFANAMNASSANTASQNRRRSASSQMHDLVQRPTSAME
jgi:hypothetical protein